MSWARRIRAIRARAPGSPSSKNHGNSSQSDARDISSKIQPLVVHRLLLKPPTWLRLHRSVRSMPSGEIHFSSRFWKSSMLSSSLEPTSPRIRRWMCRKEQNSSDIVRALRKLAAIAEKLLTSEVSGSDDSDVTDDTDISNSKELHRLHKRAV